MKYLDPVSLAKLSNMHIRAKSVVEGMLSGLHSSSLKGHSLEFAQHREYSYGDELRHIDWKVFGRSDKFFIKQFQDETNLRGYILLDASGSMNFASQDHISKLDYAKFLAASLAYLLLHQEDSASLSVFDDKIRYFLPPRHQLSHLSVIFEKLENLKSAGETEIENVLKEFGQHLKKRGLIVFISDLMSDPAEVMKALKYLRFRHHEIIVLQVLDPNELKFPYLGDNIFVHLENNKELYIDADSVRAEYIKLFQEFLAEYKIGFRQADIDYHLITTDTPVELALARCLSNRK